MKANAQKNTHLQAAQSQAQTKACKRVFFSATQEKLFFKIPSPSENKKYPIAQPDNTKTMAVKLNRDNGLQGQTTEHQQPTAVWRNGGGRAKLNSSFSNQQLCLVDSEVLRNPPLRQAAKRYTQTVFYLHEQLTFH